MNMSTRPTPPPEAALLKAALKRSRISQRAAADQAGISEARWRQITSGYQSVSGTPVPIRAPADTLARMAQAVGITATELTEAGRADAAEKLGETAPRSAVDFSSDPAIDAIAALLATLPPEAQDEVLRRVGRVAPDRTGLDNGGTHTRKTG
ncbi:helix-turn-helix domain-containing protein [Kitasatospora aureofaciens]|uniref:helix-turn-helix domain-containing protein n=1 Tax=Kitasatospora aureofaciens TaxID=1894 RepID=UPI0033ED9E8A